MASDGAATVLVAHTDQDSVELVARVAEGAGHRAVRSTDPTPPSVVETAVHELALVVVLDTRSTSLEEVTAVAGGLRRPGLPGGTLLLTDGRVAAEHALHSGPTVSSFARSISVTWSARSTLCSIPTR
ncbi:MAG: hypothetical protein H6519_04290 [Microthrixaceae bacterium]|nr:hypothetical protein [Microthrixaceae bacterium]